MLEHPNIIACREIYSTTGGDLCIVMDLGEGGSLDQAIKN